MQLVIGADHRGWESAQRLAERLRMNGHDVQLHGPEAGTTCDYPEPAWVIGRAVAGGACERGVLLCGTGIGTSIAANKIAGVRAAVVHDELTAELSRSHNDANVLCMSADLLGQRLIEKIVDLWIKTEFDGGRHARRIEKISAIEQNTDPKDVTP
ncbi:MAG: ribose 5-phosphate isomerase B [Planctomycetota bacterium]